MSAGPRAVDDDLSDVERRIIQAFAAVIVRSILTEEAAGRAAGDAGRAPETPTQPDVREAGGAALKDLNEIPPCGLVEAFAGDA